MLFFLYVLSYFDGNKDNEEQKMIYPLEIIRKHIYMHRNKRSRK